MTNMAATAHLGTHAADRDLMPDLLRAFALMGIVIVNIFGFAWPMETGLPPEARSGPIDGTANMAMLSLFFAKSYPLFSMMFGAGLAYQIASAERIGAAFEPRYWRRLAALFVLGVLHFVFFWMGDILMIYAVTGVLLFTFKDFSVKVLVRVGLGLIAANVLLLGAFAGLFFLVEAVSTDPIIPEAELQKMLAASMAAFAEGSFLDAALHRAGQLPGILIGGLFLQGVSVLGFFALGLAAYKSGAIKTPGHGIWRQGRLIFLPLGLVFTVLGAWLMHSATLLYSSATFAGMMIIFAASPLVVAGYIGLIAKACEGEPGPVRRFFARAGSASLTAYLLQSLILSFVFSAYGLNYFASLNAAALFGIAVGVGLISLCFTSIWRVYAGRGPMEVLLRGVTYWGEGRR